MNVLIVPDKFKGSLTALEVCNAVEKGILKKIPDAQIRKLPLADGGEGSLDALEEILNFKRIYLTVNNPLFKPVKASFGLLGDSAYIEMATASGLQLLKETKRNPLYTTSFGTGEMILNAVQKGAKKVYLFIGGSATNDAGMGIASALGYVFLDEDNHKLEPTGYSLGKVKSIECQNVISMKDTTFVVLTDVNNLLYGKNGAAHVFAKQKGANSSAIIELDAGLKNMAHVMESTFGVEVSNLPGGGAAGGVGAGVAAFLNGKIQSGIQSILELLQFDKLLQNTDLVITGEGLIDKQTLEGKVVKGVVDSCLKAHKKVAVVCGDMELTGSNLTQINTPYIVSIKNNNISKEEAINNASTHLIARTSELIESILSS